MSSLKKKMKAEVMVTIGSKEGLAHLMLATLDRGDTDDFCSRGGRRRGRRLI
jgi:aspartate/methionine/tyrosine aminotransferase